MHIKHVYSVHTHPYSTLYVTLYKDLRETITMGETLAKVLFLICVFFFVYYGSNKKDTNQKHMKCVELLQVICITFCSRY